MALYLAYVGHGYQGMQRNPGAKTIEDELFRALHAAGAISDANADENGFVKVGLGCSSVGWWVGGVGRLGFQGAAGSRCLSGCQLW